jgi:glycine cleavage system H protein
MIVAGFDFPDELLVHVEHQVWARVEDDGSTTVGITALGIHLAGGEIYMCRPKVVGSMVAQGQGVAVVELAKSVVSVKSPIGGTIVATNLRLAAEPELVHRNPYGEGWIARLMPARLAVDCAQLVQGEAGRAALEHHAWLYREGG